MTIEQMVRDILRTAIRDGLVIQKVGLAEGGDPQTFDPFDLERTADVMELLIKKAITDGTERELK